jgi:tetratricopeptide (TPR) repeat protein
MYIYIGEYEEALEWAKMGIESSVRTTGYPSLHVEAHIRIATALINMGKIEEGIAHLDIANKMSLTRASEKSLLEIYNAYGYLERKKGDIETSIYYFEKALEISERTSWQHKINVCLTRLAESEIMQFTHFEQSRDDIGPWLSRLETMSREKDLPGILGLALLLKAELRLNQGRVDDAYSILDEAIEISKNPGTKFLEKKIAKLVLTAFPKQS